MVIDFAKINVKEQPVLILQNLDDTPIGVLKYAFNVEADLCYNLISQRMWIESSQRTMVELSECELLI